MTDLIDDAINKLISIRHSIELEPRFLAELIDGKYVQIDANSDGILLVAIHMLKMVRCDSKLSELNIDEAAFAESGSFPIVINRTE